MRLFRPLLALAGTSLAIAMAITPVTANIRYSAGVKVAMVYNIMRFTHFPDSPKQLILCGLADDPVASELRALDGRMVGRAPIGVVLLSEVSDVGPGCDVIYLDSTSPRNVPSLTRGQIVIGSATNFAEGGGTVGLISFGGQIRFVVNDRSARRTGVSFSAQLLQLAAKVIS